MEKRAIDSNETKVSKWRHTTYGKQLKKRTAIYFIKTICQQPCHFFPVIIHISLLVITDFYKNNFSILFPTLTNVHHLRKTIMLLSRNRVCLCETDFSVFADNYTVL